MMMEDTIRFVGCGTALITPFTDTGKVDEDALRFLTRLQLDAQVDFIVPCGSTGEAATLSIDEHLQVVSIVADTVNGKIPVVAGAGSNDTAKAVELTKRVLEVGATHVLHVSPAYNKPPQRGIAAHFRTIADKTGAKIIMYNVPGRTSSNMEPATTLQLSVHPEIIGIKEASGDLSQINSIITGRPDGFLVFSGDDALTLPAMGLGADGVISVLSNIFPKEMVSFVRAILDGRFDHARMMHNAMLPLFKAAFIESNPIPAKAILAEWGLISPVLRSPLVSLAQDKRAIVFNAVHQVRENMSTMPYWKAEY